ncbi:hypothetical protein DL96DRAFT_1567274 [Flagelloscypha sp. PMI_526]|nr:hypothetical protein DL96DRAFT_1567274 [Flagelloscypha sp. PMI_526]
MDQRVDIPQESSAFIEEVPDVGTNVMPTENHPGQFEAIVMELQRQNNLTQHMFETAIEAKMARNSETEEMSEIRKTREDIAVFQTEGRQLSERLTTAINTNKTLEQEVQKSRSEIFWKEKLKHQLRQSQMIDKQRLELPSAKPIPGFSRSVGRETRTSEEDNEVQYQPSDSVQVPDNPLSDSSDSSDENMASGEEDEDETSSSSEDVTVDPKLVTHIVREVFKQMGGQPQATLEGTSHSKSGLKQVVDEQQVKIGKKEHSRWLAAVRSFLFLCTGAEGVKSFVLDRFAASEEEIEAFMEAPTDTETVGPRAIAHNNELFRIDFGPNWTDSPWNHELLDVLTECLQEYQTKDGDSRLVKVSPEYIRALFARLLGQVQGRYKKARRLIASSGGDMRKLTELDEKDNREALSRTQRGHKFDRRSTIVKKVIRAKTSESSSDLYLWHFIEELLKVLGREGMSSEELVTKRSSPLKTHYVVRILSWRSDYIAKVLTFIDGYEVRVRDHGTSFIATRASTPRYRSGESGAEVITSTRKAARCLPKNLYSSEWLETRPVYYKIELEVEPKEFRLLREELFDLNRLRNSGQHK